MRVLFCTLPPYGHVLPLVPLAQAFALAGHDVKIATGGPLLGRLPVPTVGAYPDRTLDEAEAEVVRRHPELADVPATEKWRFGLELFGDVEYDTLRAGAERVIETERPDIVVYETYSVGAAAAAIAHDIPTVAVGVSPWSFFFDLLYRTVKERNGIEWRDTVLADLYLDTFPASTWSTENNAPSNRRPVRPVAWSPGEIPLPAWLTTERLRPRVYVTLGTVVFGATHALDAALGVLDERDVDVLVAVGPEGDPAAIRPRGARIRVERFVDQARVIPRVDAVVHHGGSGTALAALTAGLPMVVMPQGADQFQNADALAAMGVARAFLPGMGDDALAEHVDAALTDHEMKAASGKLAREIAATPSPAEVASDLATRFR